LNERSCYYVAVSNRSSSRVQATRSDGQRSRVAILRAAVDEASMNGLEGLSIGSLADRLGMSKSGLFAHFGSKEALQLATVARAREIFERDVLAAPASAPEGAARLVALCEAYISYIERLVFPGGCFFASAAAELDARRGPVRDQVAAVRQAFAGRLADLAREAQRRGELDEARDPNQLAFEIDALLLGANAWFTMTGDAAVLQRARLGIETLLIGR
jgi:AcrR family transcriptional regulator